MEFTESRVEFLIQIIYHRDFYFTYACIFTILDMRSDHQITNSLPQYSVINSQWELQYTSNFDRTGESPGTAQHRLPTENRSTDEYKYPQARTRAEKVFLPCFR